MLIALLLGLSFVHCSQNECEPFGDDFPSERFEVTFETEGRKESINCGKEVPLQEFTDYFKTAAPTVKYSNAVRVYNENGPSFKKPVIIL